MLFSTVLLSALAALASAQFQQGSGNPSGNPISRPGLNEQVPAGTAYAITWEPTNTEKVSIILLQGPSTNVVPIMTIVASTDNTGSYSWNVPTTLVPDTTHYGIEIICEDGSYQYSTQFGISNSAYVSSSTSASSTSGGSVTSSASPVSYSGSMTGYPSNTTSTSTSGSATAKASTTPSTSASVSAHNSYTTASASVSPKTSASATTLLTSTASGSAVVPSSASNTLFSATPSSAKPTIATATGAATVNAAMDFSMFAMLGLVGAALL